jgi:hypothetical protein
MKKNIAVLNRQGIALFNFMSMKHLNNKRIGELTIGDFVEICAFLEQSQMEKAIVCSNSNDNRKNNQNQKGKK